MAPEKRKIWSYTEEQMLEALQDVQNGSSLQSAARLHGVPRSTLRLKVNGKTPLERRMGPMTVLPTCDEAILEEWVKTMARAGFPVTADQLQDSVQKILEDTQRETIFKNNRPGKKWLSSFLKRHQSISKRVAENLTLSRASVKKEQIAGWFNEIETYLKENNSYFEILKDPKRVFNGDESAFFLNPKGNKVLASKGNKSVYLNVNSDEKECLTVLITASAAGVVAPPMIVFKYERIPQHVATSVPEEWGVGKSENGWMTQATFYEYITNIFHPWLLRNEITLPVIFFVDGHTSHLTLHLSTFCKNNGIILVALFPNTTHFMQPMDVSVFRTLKENWKVKVHDWRLKNLDQPILKKQHFSPLLKQVLEETLTPAIVENGFRKCGLVPWNPKAPDMMKELVVVVSTASSDVSLDSKHVEHALTVIEKFIDLEKLSLFKTCESTSWTGAIEDSSLFKIWQDMRAVVSRQTETETPQEAMDVDVSLMPEDASFPVLDSSDLNILNMEVEANMNGELLPEKALEATTNEEITPSQEQFILLPSPFKKCLVWPEEKKNSSVKRNKEKIPSVVSSEMYQAYLKKKEDKKLQQEREKKERANERTRKKLEKEEIMQKKKAMKVKKTKVTRNNLKPTTKKRSNGRKKKNIETSSEDETQDEDEWLPSDVEDQIVLSEDRSSIDEEMPTCKSPPGNIQEEFVDNDDLLKKADELCLILEDELGMQKGNHEDALEQFVNLQDYADTAQHSGEQQIPSGNENEASTSEEQQIWSRVESEASLEPSVCRKPDVFESPDEQKIPEIVRDANFNLVMRDLDELSIEQGDYIIALLKHSQKTEKNACKVVEIDETGVYVVPLICCNRMKTLFQLSTTKNMRVTIEQIYKKLPAPSAIGEKNIRFPLTVEI